MDPPPPPSPSMFPTANHPDSANSSPRSSRHDTTWDDHPLPPVPSSKLRLMCSYGGHIIPRPHDKSLCYVGGDTRIVVLDRHSALSDLHSRLSHTLLNGRHFTLKYQLPSEDLDSLISLASDEDLDNMIEEYDRTTTAASPLKPSRLRLFLFPSKPETAASMGSLLDDAKSETWFVDALNGSGLLPRGLSESAAMDTLLELDRGMTNSDSCTDLVAQTEQSFGNSKQVTVKFNAQEQVVETSSSFGSSSSSPSMSNLPPIKVRGEDYIMVGLDEPSHLRIAPNLANATSPPVLFVNVPDAVRSSCGGDRVIGDDEKSERSDHGTAAQTGLRKPPLPLQTVQRKVVDIHNLPSPDSKHAGGYNLPSPDSVASDCSIASGGSLSKRAMYDDATQPVTRENRVSTTTANDPKMMMNQDPSSDQIQVQQLADCSLPSPQYIPNTHYIHHQHTAMPVSSYYPIYVHHQTQQTDQQYPMYMLSPQTPTHPSYDAAMAVSSRTLTPPLPPVYPTKNEMAAANMHQVGGAAAGPMLVQVPAHQFQQHYIGVQQMPAAAAGGGNYIYEYSHHLQDQGYYAQQVAASSAPPPPQYQTMTPATAVMFSQVSTQVASDSNPQHS
ncbi:hypothetical protein C2S52_020935 [Perilla frutescens var. hirtella]|nr:hypothetical protein C2S52_020935 [Perilla frutescens var. hirtella]